MVKLDLTDKMHLSFDYYAKSVKKICFYLINFKDYVKYNKIKLNPEIKFLSNKKISS